MELVALASAFLLLSTIPVNSQPATISFYAKAPASTFCGIDNGPNGASASPIIYSNHAACGACYAVSCDAARTLHCHRNAAPITVTVTNLCPRGKDCMGNARSLTVTRDLFLKLATSPKVGVLPVKIVPTNCQRRGGVTFQLDKASSKYYLGITVANVGGTGQLTAVSARLGAKGAWVPLTKVFGSKWGLNKVNNLGQVISLRLTSAGGKVIIIPNIIPARRITGGKYISVINF